MPDSSGRHQHQASQLAKMDPDFAIRGCRHIKRALFMLCRYPAFTSKYIRKHIDRPGTSAEELADYKNNWVRAKRWRATLLVSVYLSSILLASFTLYEWLKAYDFTSGTLPPAPEKLDESQQEDSPQQRGELAPMEHISCIITNCTRLGPLKYRYGNTYAPHSRARLIEDVSRLPLYPICNPRMDHYFYHPGTRLDAFGTLANAVIIYNQFLLGFWVIVQQALVPSSDDIVMFITAPQVTVEFYRRRIRNIMRKMAYSLKASRSRLANETKHSAARETLASGEARFDADLRTSLFHQWDPYRGRFCPSSSFSAAKMDSSNRPSRRRSKRHEAKVEPASGKQELEQVVDECLPIIRTEWWRSRVARVMLHAVLWGQWGVIAIAVGIFILCTGRFRAKGRLFEQFELEMSRLNCFIWHESQANSLKPQHAIRLSRVRLHWTPMSVFETNALSYLAGVSILLMLAYLWCSVLSTSVWLAEMRLFLVASVIATRFQHQRERAQAERELAAAGYPVEALLRDIEQCSGGRMRASDKDGLSKQLGANYYIDTRHFFRMENLRQQFKDTTYLFQNILLRRIERRDKWTHNARGEGANKPSRPKYDWHRLNAKSGDWNCAQRFLAEIMFPLSPTERQRVEADELDRTEYDVDTLERVYINLRLLAEYVDSLKSGMRVAVAVTYLLNYGVLFLAVIFRNRFPTKIQLETTILIGFAFVLANYIIFLAADVHATARQVHPLIWSLIAQLTYSQDLRVRHIRLLWLKQTVALETQGGMAMSCLGVPITYVYIIQLMLWTATIVGIALKASKNQGFDCG